MKNCAFTFCVWFRKNDADGPAYCVEITCTVRTPKASWHGMTDSLETAKNIIDNFPLVSGGLASAEGGFLINKDCIIVKIPRKGKR